MAETNYIEKIEKPSSPGTYYSLKDANAIHNPETTPSENQVLTYVNGSWVGKNVHGYVDNNYARLVAGATSVDVSYTDTFVGAYATDLLGQIVQVDMKIYSTKVEFTIDSAIDVDLICYVNNSVDEFTEAESEEY